MARNILGEYAREGRSLAPLVLLSGALLCLFAWGFAFSPAGLPLLGIGTAVVIAAVILRPTPLLALTSTVVLFLAWGGPIWVARALSAI